MTIDSFPRNLTKTLNLKTALGVIGDKLGHEDYAHLLDHTAEELIQILYGSNRVHFNVDESGPKQVCARIMDGYVHIKLHQEFSTNLCLPLCHLFNTVNYTRNNFVINHYVSRRHPDDHTRLGEKISELGRFIRYVREEVYAYNDRLHEGISKMAVEYKVLHVVRNQFVLSDVLESLSDTDETG